MERKLYLKEWKCYTMIYWILGIVFILFSTRDAFLYKNTVAKILQADTVKYEQSQSKNLYEQKIIAIIMNGEYKGETIELQNLFSKSMTVDEKYAKGNQVFLTVHQNDGKLTGKITGLKRDTFVLVITLMFLYLLLLMAGKRAAAVIFSVLLNIILLFGALCSYDKGRFVLPVTIILMILFTVISLICAAGIKKVSAVAILSTLTTVVLIGFLYLLVVKIAGEPEYFMMEYTEYLNNASNFGMLFFAEILVGGLGAIMDVAITIGTTTEELIHQNPSISAESLYDGIRHVADDIMGTMINVLFLSYFCGTIPLILIKLINHYGFTEIFKFHIPFEIIRFLTGSIGIILAIPVSLAISIFIFKKRGVSE